MRNDLDELIALNCDYVASVQNSDVKRFDEILAEDFYCSNPDKSLVDRAGFLKQTAVPVTIRISRPMTLKFACWAISPSFMPGPATPRADGQQAPAATPIAGRGSGRWLAVSAHVSWWRLTSRHSGPRARTQPRDVIFRTPRLFALTLGSRHDELPLTHRT